MIKPINTQANFHDRREYLAAVAVAALKELNSNSGDEATIHYDDRDLDVDQLCTDLQEEFGLSDFQVDYTLNDEEEG